MIARSVPGTALRAAAVFCGVGLGVFAAPAQAQLAPFQAPVICAMTAPDVRAGYGLRSPHNQQYTTAAVCAARANKPAGEADWGAVHWDQYGGGRTRNGVRYWDHRRGTYYTDPADQIVGENTRENNVEITVKTGVRIAATGLVDMRGFWVDGALKLKTHGGPTLIVEKGATIEFSRTPSYWPADDPNRPSDGTELYYSSAREATNSHSGIYMSSSGWAPISLTLNGNVDFNPRFGGSIGHWASNGSAIVVHMTDYVPVSEGRKNFDVNIVMGADSIVRNVAGSAGGNGMYVEQNGEDGDIVIDLAAGSLLDVSAEGGRAIWAWLLPGSNFSRDSAPDADGDNYQSGDVIVDAGGTIRAAVRRSPTSSTRQGSGINARNSGLGRVRVVSSGTIATVQGLAIDAQVLNAANDLTDDPETTDTIEGHIVDVTGGSVETRGGTAIYAHPRTAGAAFAVRVAEGATVRAQALTEEDYENGAITQEQLGASGNRYIYPTHVYGWRTVEAERPGAGGETATVNLLEPVMHAIVISGPPSGAGVEDRVIVSGTVETIGASAQDAAIRMQRGGAVTVGRTGVVKASSGLAIAGGYAPPAEPGEDYEAPETDLAVTVESGGRIEGDIRILDAGALTATVMSGGAVTGTIHNPRSPFTVADEVRIGRILYDNGGAVTVAGGGEITGVEIDGTREAIRANAGDLTVTVAADGEVAGNIDGRGAGNLKVAVSGEVTGDIIERGAGNLDVTVSNAVTGNIRGEDAGEHTVAIESAGAVTGTVRLPTGAMTVAGTVGRIHYDNGGAITVNANGKITGLEVEGVREAIRGDAGDLTVTVHGGVTGNIEARGDGDLTVTVSETGTIEGEIFGRGGGTHTIEIAEKARVAGTVHNPKRGTTISGAVGRVLFDNGGALTIAASGRVSGVGGEAIRSAAGDLEVTVAGEATGNVESRGGALAATVTGTVEGDILGLGAGEHTVAVRGGGMVTGTVRLAASEVNVEHGAAGRVLLDKGGSVKVGARGRIAGLEIEGAKEAIRAGAGDLTVAIASGGAVAGVIEGRGAGGMTVNAGGKVTGAILGKGAGKHEVTVASGGSVTGNIVDMDAGDLVATVAGSVTGSIEERGAGDLTVTVAGSVSGDIRGLGAGSHTVTVASGGSVAGAIRGAGAGSHAAMVAGRAARVLYDNGGSVTIAASGTIAGVETSDGGREAIRSAAGDLAVDVAAMGTVTGDIRGAGDGDLDVDVSGEVEGGIFGLGAAGDLTVEIAAMGTVTGDIRGAGDGDLNVGVSGTVEGGIFGLGGGEHDVHVKSGGSVEGLIHLAASTVTVDGAARSVLFDRGGTVNVGSGGRISGLDGRAAHSAAGDLTVTVNGVVMGSVSDTGPGNLAVTVANALTGDVIGGGGGAHRLTVQPGGVFKGNAEGVELVRVAGDAEGMLHVPAGGAVEVAAGGKLVGAEEEGRRVAVVAETGALTMTVDGEVQGAVEARDAAAASTVKVGAGGEIDGRVTLAGAGSEIAVDGAAQSVDVPRGAVTVGENGRIEEPIVGAETVTIRAAAGETDEEAALRLGGGRIDAAGATITLEREGRVDSQVRITADGRIEVGPAPRHRVYEALPSVLLALNALPAHGDRFAAAGAPRGAFARLDAAGGDRHPASSTASSHHDYRRFGFEAGFEGAVGERGVFAISVHHVRGRADVETDADTAAGGGRVEITGTGARISGAWLPAENVYVSGQAAATLYETDLDSDAALEGALARDLSGRGYAAGVEVGRRLELGRVTLTPRAGADWSMVEMSSFTDSVNERVSLDAGRRITARAGVRAGSAALPGGAGAMFATLDLERELSGAMETTAADRPFKAEAEATWARLGLGAAHEWADGRIALRANAAYAAARHGNRDFSGSATLTVRF